MNKFRTHSLFVVAAWLLGLFVVFGCGLSDQDKKPERKVVQPPGHSGGGTTPTIDRKTFSMSLPVGWTEDTKDDMHDPDSFVFFENEESCLFAVMIGKKSAGASLGDQLENQKEALLSKMTDAKVTEFQTWSTYAGKGFEIEGKVAGIALTRQRLFGFENGDNVCVITESATVGDFQTYAGDFETIRQTFKLK